MKKLAIALALTISAFTVAAHENGKSCDMNAKGKTLSLTGKVVCNGTDDCSFQTADAKTTYAVCEMSKADLPKLSASGSTVTVKGKLITCEGKEKLRIDKAGE